ncbi:MAG: tRNA (guanosine(37)-N1)-methyltransferase TrmD [Saprospiraceae bacterium]|nr:tRNA (guanosine(37)-N1)-methyltransferase TrmD [Saprospiraceae bacterium]MBK9993089.1 tRNA (guanosine(37)-N1)-methyltransferase TrmD [Saprospiraceae bacterium]
MQIDIISVIPELLRSPFEHSIMKRAHEKGLLTVNLIDLRNYGVGNYRQIDDYQFGGGAGMVLMVEPLVRCIEERKSKTNYDEIIYLTPDGATLNQRICNSLSLKQNLLIICGHYKGIDQRVRDHWITMEISVGDYVLSGGELGAAILVDSIGRLIPGVLNDETSALTDSFQDDLLAPPVYSRPAEFRELKVPEILLSGHQEKIDQWRFEESLKKTQERRPDLIRE